MLVTEPDIVTVIIEVSFWNAKSPIVVTVLGIIISPSAIRLAIKKLEAEKVFNDVQFEKELFPIIVISPNVTIVKSVHPVKVPSGITVIVGGRTIDGNAAQFWNVFIPNSVIVAGKVTVVKLVQPENVPSGITVTESGIVIDGNAAQFWNAFIPNSVIVAGKFTCVKLVQPENDPSGITVMESGIVIDGNELHPWKAFVPSDVTVEGIVTVVKLTSPLKAPVSIVVTVLGIEILTTFGLSPSDIVVPV
jgi:hypothetical protein